MKDTVAEEIHRHRVGQVRRVNYDAHAIGADITLAGRDAGWRTVRLGSGLIEHYASTLLGKLIEADAECVSMFEAQ